MTTITNTFGTLYHPVKALVLYQKDGSEANYVEAYDMNSEGFPINAHPLTMHEATKLAKALNCADKHSQQFLKPERLIPERVLYINNAKDGFAVWYTPARRIKLLFRDDLDIPSGMASIPPLVWKASRGTMYIYALPSDHDITTETVLHRAPFFNIHDTNSVCMGTVDIRIPSDCMLEAFMKKWETYFFNSYFSHLIGNHSPVKGNIIQLWQSLVNTRRKFPIKSLLPTRLTIQNLIS